MEKLLQEAIASLDEDQRIVVVLRDVEDLSIEEICEITGLARRHREVAPASRARSRCARSCNAMSELCRGARHDRASCQPTTRSSRRCRTTSTAALAAARARRGRSRRSQRRRVEARARRARRDAQRTVGAAEGARAGDVRAGRHADDPQALGRPVLRAPHVRRSRAVRGAARRRGARADRDRVHPVVVADRIAEGDPDHVDRRPAAVQPSSRHERRAERLQRLAALGRHVLEVELAIGDLEERALGARAARARRARPRRASTSRRFLRTSSASASSLFSTKNPPRISFALTAIEWTSSPVRCGSASTSCSRSAAAGDARSYARRVT